MFNPTYSKRILGLFAGSFIVVLTVGSVVILAWFGSKGVSPFDVSFSRNAAGTHTIVWLMLGLLGWGIGRRDGWLDGAMTILAAGGGFEFVWYGSQVLTAGYSPVIFAFEAVTIAGLYFVLGWLGYFMRFSLEGYLVAGVAWYAWYVLVLQVGTLAVIIGAPSLSFGQVTTFCWASWLVILGSILR